MVEEKRKTNKSKERCTLCRTLSEAKSKNFCGSVVGNTKCYYVPLKSKQEKEGKVNANIVA